MTHIVISQYMTDSMVELFYRSLLKLHGITEFAYVLKNENLWDDSYVMSIIKLFKKHGDFNLTYSE